MTVDLHKLANEGGYGSAQKALKDAGLWDERQGLEPKKWRVRCEVTFVEHDTETVTVEARDEDEAMELAEQKLEGGEYLSAEAESAEVIVERAKMKKEPSA
tara:strand:+ start:45079 stop:45381 length:303 start_codon:yes stop_codon:yes gene_type:complete